MSAANRPSPGPAAITEAAMRLAAMEERDYDRELPRECERLHIAPKQLARAVKDARAARAKAEHAKQGDRTGMPRGFRMFKTGVFRDADSDDAPPIHVCGVLRVVAWTSDATGQNPGRLIEWRDEGDREHRGVISKALFSDGGKELWDWFTRRGLWASTDPRHKLLLARYLNECVAEKRVQIVTKVGWHATQAGRVFALADRTIGPEGSEVMFQSERGDDAPPLKASGDLTEWQQAVGRLAVGNSRLTLALGAALAAPLLGLLGVGGGGFHLRGRSTSGKTTGLRVASSVWGGHDWGVTWRTTDNGLESSASRYNDLLLCLDEIGQAPSRALGDIAYMLAQGEGKARAARDGGWRETVKWRVLFLSTGEESLGARMSEDRFGSGRLKEGQSLRVLDVPADAGQFGMFETLHEFESGKALADHLLAATRRLHGTLGGAWLEVLVADQVAIAKEAQAEMVLWQQEHVPADASGQVQRAGERFALVAGAGAIAARRGLLPWPAGWAGSGAAACFRAWLAERPGGIGRGEDASAVAQVRGYLLSHGISRFAELVTTTQMKMLPEDTKLEPGDDLVEKGERTPIVRDGWRRKADDGRWEYIIPQSNIGQLVGGAGADSVAKALRDAGHLNLKGAEQGKLSVKVRLPEVGRPRCYLIKPSIFDD